jgi:hypothetical protein
MLPVPSADLPAMMKGPDYLSSGLFPRATTS